MHLRRALSECRMSVDAPTTAGRHSAPTVRPRSKSDEARRKLYSVSLSEIRKHSSEFANYHHKPSPFNLRWLSGYNHKAGVINLNNRGSTVVFYAACNCGVLYNWTTNQMRMLQGHRHMVTHLAADADGKWLITGDSGPENIITIWDSNDFFPSKTYFQPHGNMKVSKVALSADAKFMLTLGYQEKAVIFWWIWSSPQSEPHAALEIDIPRDGVLAMQFNPDDTWQFALMTRNDIWIGISRKIFVLERGQVKETDDYELKVFKPEKNINPEFGRLTCFTFVVDTSQVLVATSRGAFLVYGYTIEYKNNAETKNFDQLKFIKVLVLEEGRINVIKSIDGVVVTGNSAGEIRFYDNQLKLLYWVHGFTVDSVQGLSFNISPRSYELLDSECKKRICVCIEKVVPKVDPLTGAVRQVLLRKRVATDASTSNKPFIMRDFIVCTRNHGVGFVEFIMEKLTTIMDYKTAVATAITVHPEKPLLCVGFADGLIVQVNFLQHKVFAKLDLRDHYKIVTEPDDDSIHCDYEVTVPTLTVSYLKYSPSGLHLACGLNTGQLLFLDPVTIKILTNPPFKDTNHAVQEINFSCDSLTLALSDAGKTVLVYKFNRDDLVWRFVAKHRAHYKDVVAVFFTPQKNKDGEYKLLSLGADRIMVEYDIGASVNEQLEIFSLDRVEQTAVPLGAIVWPTPPEINPEEFRGNLPMILMANDENKYKIINYATTMTLSTVLGPRFESPVFKMQLVSRMEEEESLQYLVFATKNTIGLQKMPLDGNPWKHVGLLAHPNEITQIVYREDLGVLFAIGAKDTCVSQWAANFRSVDSTARLGSGDLDPYYCLIEDGRPGWLFQEIRDLFYYIQILCQGTFSPAMRRVKDFIPIDSLPDLMRALGFFPSTYEVENLLVEAKYKVYQYEPSTEIDFEEFVRLYLNHRPAFSDNFPHIRNAFRTFAAAENETYIMHRDELVEMLESYGECFSRDLSWYLLTILCGYTFEDRANMRPGDFSFLPENITLNELITNIMGITGMDFQTDQYSTLGSQGSSMLSSMASEDK